MTGQRWVQKGEAGIHAVGPGAALLQAVLPEATSRGRPGPPRRPALVAAAIPRPRPARTPPGPRDTVRAHHAAAGPR